MVNPNMSLMKKLVTSGLTRRCFYMLAMIWLVSLFNATEAIAQGCVMTCPPAFPPVPVSVSADCQDFLTYEDIGVTINGCTGDIVVDIIVNGVSIGNMINIGMAGSTFMVIVSNPTSGQSCMTNIMVVDNQAPLLICPADVTLECTADLSLYNGLDPSDITDCSSTTVYINDVLVSSGNCEDNIISEYVREYIVVDSFNNADTCEQLISLQKASLDSVEFPANLTGINALNCFPPPDTTPANTGIPSINGSPIVNGTFCNLSVIYQDQILPICSGSYKILRTWTVFDWCENSISIDSLQIIEILDETGPLVLAPADMTVSTNSLTCTANVQIPAALISDECSSIWTVRMEGPFGTIHSNGGFVQNLPVGVHNIIFIATNDCQLVGQDTMVLTIADLQPPVPVCNQSLAVPLNNDGFALVPASAFDAASQDNCSNVYFKVKRMTAPLGYNCANPGNPNNQFDDFIQFCCEDIPNNEIMVILRVYDLPPVAGPVSDTYLQGHYNDCMVQVEVQDKLPPQITCPSDLTISCEFPFTPENLGVFGTVVTSIEDQELICIDDPGVPGDPGLQCIGIDGLALDNCNVVVTSQATIDINNCGVGSITRTFTATDDGGLQVTCQQVITIINFDLFDIDDIVWPADYTTTNVCEIDLLDPEDLLPPFNEPVLNDEICDLVGTSYDDMVFDLTNDDEACFKILRTWTVMDWCQINTPSGGLWSHIQVIKVMNTVAPDISPIEDITECSFDPECGGLTLDFEANATDDCSGPASLTWRYSVDIDNNASFDFVSPNITNDSISFSFDFPIGTHRILYTVWDHCGNTTTEEQFITIESCTGPSAKCIHGLSTNLMPMDLNGDGEADWGMVAVQAEMFDAGSGHSCGNEITLAFSEDPTDVTRIFDCDDLGLNTIELWAIDENGLTDFCITEIDIQDNSNVCPPEQGNAGVISGSITVPHVGKLSNAMVYLDGSNLPGTPSGLNGYFAFPSMPLGGQYTVRPVKTDDAKNGVTTLDLLRIQKHLLGIQTFTTPYQYIAADANDSKGITALDIIHLRKLILGYYDVLPNNTSWRFVDKAHIFPDPANPWGSPWDEVYLIDPFAGSMNVDFDAVKVGDLNSSAQLNATGGIILPRTANACELQYNVTQTEYDIYKVDLSLSNARLYQAIQFSFDWDKSSYELVDMQISSALTEDDIRISTLPAVSSSIAFFNLTPLENNTETLVTIWVRKINPAGGRFMLYQIDKPTTPVAYEFDAEDPIKVSLTQGKVANSNIINHPNPFKDKTYILYTSEVEEPAQLRVFNMDGKQVYARDVSLQQGTNEFIITRSELKGAGIYLYEISSGYQYSTNRMIIVE